MTTPSSRQPSLFIPHGGGPCFFMPDPVGTWTGMAAYLRSIAASLAVRPIAILVVSGHWETRGFAFTGSAAPALIYDYGGFPPHTYDLRYDPPGAPDLAARALAPLRDEGVLIVASGMSFHSMRGYGDPRFTQPSQDFDTWLTAAIALPGNARETALNGWADAPSARLSHPRAEHLLPLMVAAGASDAPGIHDYSELVMHTAISGYRFA